MILVDANLLIYAHVSGFEQHAPAREWLEEQLSAGPRVGLPWPSLLAFLRIVSNPRIFAKPEPVTKAWHQVELWLSAKSAWVPTPTEDHATFMAALIEESGVEGNLVPDAHLAALALEHGLTLCSTDGDYARFKKLSWQNPLGGRLGHG